MNFSQFAWLDHLFLSTFSGSGRNSRTLKVNLACFRNHGDHPLHLLCMGIISSGMVVISITLVIAKLSSHSITFHIFSTKENALLSHKIFKIGDEMCFVSFSYTHAATVLFHQCLREVLDLMNIKDSLSLSLYMYVCMYICMYVCMYMCSWQLVC